MRFLPMGAHMGNEDLEAMDHPVEVDAQHPVPILRGHLFDGRPVHGDARIGAEDMHMAKGVEGLLRRALQLLLDADVGLHGQRLRAQPVDLAQRLLQPLAPDVAQNDVHALPREGARHAKANA